MRTGEFCNLRVVPGIVLLSGALLLGTMLLSELVYGVQPRSPAVPQFQYSTTSQKPVIEYTLVHQMLANPDPEPLLRIYGDGRVHVHFPEYMKNAGDYDMRISQADLRGLIRSLSQNGFIDFDEVATRNAVQQVEAQRRSSTGTLSYISDHTVTVIDLALDFYQRSSAHTPILGMRKQVRWENLQHDAQRNPQLQALQGTAASAGLLHAFTRHPGLKKR